jgi:sulfate permease, SulP family
VGTSYFLASRLWDWLGWNLEPHLWIWPMPESTQSPLVTITSGLVLGILNVALAVAFGALIFSGDLASHVSVGIGLTLFGGLVVGGIVAAFSSYRGTIATPQDIPATILALVAAAIYTRLSTDLPESAVVATIVGAIALTSLLSGVFYLLLGQFRLGNLVRFLPYPVIGGFLAGIGWLLLVGGLGVMTESLAAGPPGLHLLETQNLLHWVPGMAYALFLAAVSRYVRHHMAIPVALCAGVIVFYLAITLAGVSPAAAGDEGLLLGPFPEAGMWLPLNGESLAQIEWRAIWGEGSNILAILTMSVISLLLNASGMELELRHDMDLNRELKVTGLANILGSLGSGTPGFHALADTMLAHRMGSRTRLVGLMSAGMCGVALFFGAGLMGYFPRPVAGGLLAFLGLLFLMDWVVEARRRLPLADYVVVLTILAAVAAIGFLQGVAVGIVLAVGVFIVKYSRIELIKHFLSGADYQGMVARGPTQKHYLETQSSRIRILVLSGYIFFGTANYLLTRIRSLIGEQRSAKERYFILDFRLVSGLDSSALNSFVRMYQLAEANGIALLLTHLNDADREQVRRSCHLQTSDTHLRFFSDLDLGVQWCEEQILAAEPDLARTDSGATTDEFSEVFTPQYAPRIRPYFERLVLDGGEVLIEQGGATENLYFIEAGQVTIAFDRGDGSRLRLRSLREGTIVGEMGLYLDDTRSAWVTTDGPTIAHRISAAAIKRMESEDPEAASAFHQGVARVLAARLDLMNRMVRHLI